MTNARIAVFGIFGKTNLGNEATLSAYLAAIRERVPGAEVVCVGPADSRVSERYGIALQPMDPLRLQRHFWRLRDPRLIHAARGAAQWVTERFRLRLAFQALRGFRLFVVPGTGILDDFGQGAFDLPHHLLRWCRAARAHSIPVQFISIGAEPVSGRLTRRMLRRAAALGTYRSYRDEPSRANAAGMGLSVESDPVYPDLAFSLPGEAMPPSRDVTWPPRSVGVGVMGYYGWNQGQAAGERIYLAYLHKLRRFVTWLVDRGHSVRLLIGDQRPDERPVRDLISSFANGPESLAASIHAEPISDVAGLLREVVATDITMATRYHNVLLSLMLGRPTVSLGYSGKNDALMAQVEMEAYCQEIELFDVERLQRQFEDLAGLSEPPVRRLRAWAQTNRMQLARQYARCLGDLSGSSDGP